MLLVLWIGIGRSKFYQWRDRYGKVNEHNGWIPRDHWVTPEERRAVIEYHDTHADNGYRRLTYMMMDDDVVALSPSTVYRILKKEGKLWQPPVVSSRRGKGFAQPNHAHRTGISTSAMFAFPARSITCAALSTAIAAISSPGD